MNCIIVTLVIIVFIILSIFIYKLIIFNYNTFVNRITSINKDYIENQKNEIQTKYNMFLHKLVQKYNIVKDSPEYKLAMQDYNEIINKEWNALINSISDTNSDNVPKTTDEVNFLQAFINNSSLININIQITETTNTLDEMRIIYEKVIKIISEENSDYDIKYFKPIALLIAIKNIIVPVTEYKNRTLENDLKDSIDELLKQQFNTYLYKFVKDNQDKSYNNYLQVCKVNNTFPISNQRFNKLMKNHYKIYQQNHK